MAGVGVEEAEEGPVNWVSLSHNPLGYSLSRLCRRDPSNQSLRRVSVRRAGACLG